MFLASFVGNDVDLTDSVLLSLIREFFDVGLLTASVECDGGSVAVTASLQPPMCNLLTHLPTLELLIKNNSF